MSDEEIRTEVWWLLTEWFNRQGIVPDIFEVERMVDRAMAQAGY